jgi:hypothetical protein
MCWVKKGRIEGRKEGRKERRNDKRRDTRNARKARKKEKKEQLMEQRNHKRGDVTWPRTLVGGLKTKQALVEFQVRSCGICGRQRGAGMPR